MSYPPPQVDVPGLHGLPVSLHCGPRVLGETSPELDVGKAATKGPWNGCFLFIHLINFFRQKVERNIVSKLTRHLDKHHSHHPARISEVARGCVKAWTSQSRPTQEALVHKRFVISTISV